MFSKRVTKKPSNLSNYASVKSQEFKKFSLPILAIKFDQPDNVVHQNWGIMLTPKITDMKKFYLISKPN